MANFKYSVDINVVFDTGHERRYSSIVEIDGKDPYLCFRGDDGCFYTLNRSRVLSMELTSQSDEKTAAQISGYFD